MKSLLLFVTFSMIVAAVCAQASDEALDAFANRIRRALDSGDAEQLVHLANWKGLNEMSIPFNRVRFSVIAKKYTQKEFDLTFRSWRPDEPTAVENDLFRKRLMVPPSHVITIHIIRSEKATDINLPIAKIDGQFLICCEQIVLKRKIKPGDFSNPPVEAIPRS